MRKIWKGSTFLASAALFGAVVMSGTTAMAGTVDVSVDVEITSTLVEALGNDMDFGSIELSPTGPSVVTIDASTGAVATPTATNGSVVTPGAFGSGLVTVESPIALTIGIAVTDTTTLSGAGAPIPFTAGIANSTTTALPHVGGATTNIHVGGVITIPGGQTTGAYTGTVTVTLTYT